MESVGLLPTLQISVTNPEKHGEGVKAYVSFAVITQTDLPSFNEGKIEVRRRYNDFVWLRNQLVANNPEIIVPPLPPKLSDKFLARFKDEFLEKRRKALELFLNRVALHPSLIASIDLNTFLCAKEWELKTVQSESESTTFSGIAKKITNLKVGNKPNPDDPQAEKFEQIRKYFDDLQAHLLQIHIQIEAVVKKNQDLISDYTSIAPGFLWLAQSETELSSPLYAIGKVYTDSMIPSIHEINSQQEYGLMQSLHQYVLTCEVALDVIRRRDKILGEFLVSQRNIENYRNELLRTQEESNNPGSTNKSTLLMLKDKMTFEDPQTKIQRLELKLEQEEKNLQTKQHDLERVSSTVVSELERFHKWKTYDFQLLFQDMIQTQMEFHRKVQQSWESLLPGIQELSLENSRRTFWMTSSRKSLLAEH